MDFAVDLEAVLCDLDGTLFHLAVDWDDLKRRLETIGGAHGETIGDIVAGAPAELRPRMLEAISREEIRGATEGTVAAGAAAFLREVTGHYKVGIVSRNHREAVELAVDRIGVPVDVVVTRDDVRAEKPDPEGVRLALAGLKAAPERAVMVGDSSHDVMAAHAANMRCIVVRNPRMGSAPAGGDKYLDDLDQIGELLLART